jgi:hypothetical protein
MLAALKAVEAERHFPKGISFPSELRKLFLWAAKHGYPISGAFELVMHDAQILTQRRMSVDAVRRLAIFGSGVDGAHYALWMQDDGEVRIVHIGAEDGNHFVIARTMREFLLLLAIGYADLGIENTADCAMVEGINPTFRKWVAREFMTIVPARGSMIVVPAQAESEDFAAWVRRQSNA